MSLSENDAVNSESETTPPPREGRSWGAILLRSPALLIPPLVPAILFWLGVHLFPSGPVWFTAFMIFVGPGAIVAFSFALSLALLFVFRKVLRGWLIVILVVELVPTFYLWSLMIQKYSRWS